MPVIITELAIQADGTFAIELHNNGASSADMTSYFVSAGHDGIYPFFSLPAGTTLPAGGYLVVGHSTVPGVDVAPDDTHFDDSPIDGVLLLNHALAPADHLGQVSGTDLSVDTTYQSDPSRSANTNPNVDNSGDWSPTAGFANNSLGAACFLSGTMIATPMGERTVETLQAGDLVLTADGRAVPVLWLGEQLVKKRIGQVPAALEPVCIKAGALGNHSDLYVTADHGMIIDGLVINAGALANGETITWAPYDTAYTVYHIETAAHDVILANGAAAETLVDAAGRRAFDNHADYLALHSAERIIPELPLPRISSARLVPQSVRDRLRTPMPEAKLSA